MKAAILLGIVAIPTQPLAHPLDPLSAEELSSVAQIIRSEGKASTNDLFTLIALHEPPKDEVYAWKPGTDPRREAFAVVFDPEANATSEAIVNLNSRSVISWKRVPAAQPMWTETEDAQAVELVRENADWQAAMLRRGITNFSEVAIATLMPGHYSMRELSGRRLFRTTFHHKRSGANFYGPPIEGVEALVDLTDQKVVQVIDTGRRAIAQESTDFFDERVRAEKRSALKPLVTLQPEGASFKVEGNEIQWDRWRFRYAFHPREGLVLYLVRYQDADRERSILYRASISEMLVPYGDPARTWFWRNAVDEGEYGLGHSAAPLLRGRNTANHATLLDVPMADERGVSELEHDLIDIYEREGDTLWTHFDFDSQANEARRGRELVIGFIATVANYDYSFHWIFRQDASIEFVAELTGVILTKGVDARTCEVCNQKRGKAGVIEPLGEDRFGTLVAPHTVGVNHQHFINMRLDFDVDGVANSVKEINVRSAGVSRANPFRNAVVAVQTVFGREREAARDVNLASHRSRAVFNPNITTALGHYPAYALEPGANALPFLPPESVVRKSVGFVDHHFFATVFHRWEMYAAGPYPVAAAKPANIVTWTRNNEPILNEDVVVWYTFGLTHVPRPEDFPVMPAARAGFKLLPKGFFDRNPALDVASP